jgi:hypothetical protein
MSVRPIIIPAAGLAMVLVLACTPATAPPPAASAAGVTPSAFRLPGGAGCAGEVARYRAIIENDLATGHVNRRVYERVSTEIARTDATCAGGRDAEAIRMIAATKSRYGYR